MVIDMRLVNCMYFIHTPIRFIKNEYNIIYKGNKVTSDQMEFERSRVTFAWLNREKKIRTVILFCKIKRHFNCCVGDFTLQFYQMTFENNVLKYVTSYFSNIPNCIC